MALAGLCVLTTGIVLYPQSSTQWTDKEEQRLRVMLICRKLDRKTFPDGPWPGSWFKKRGAALAREELRTANVCYDHGAYPSAEWLQRDAVALLDQPGANKEEVRSAQYLLVRTLEVRGNTGEADSVLSRADPPGPRAADSPNLQLQALWMKAAHYLMQLNIKEARALYVEGDQLRRRVAPDDPQWAFRFMGGIAWCDVREGQFQKVVDSLKDLTDGRYTAQLVGVAEWTKVLSQYAVALSNLGRYQEAEQTASRVVDVVQFEAGKQSYLTGLAYQYLAAIQQAMGSFDQALQSEQHAYDADKGGNPRNGPAIQATLGALEYLDKQMDPALKHLKGAKQQLLKLGAGADSFRQLTDFYLASTLLDAGQPREALRLAEGLDPAKLAAADATPEWPARKEALIGRCLIKTGQTVRGGQMVQQAFAVLSHAGVRDWVLAEARPDLAYGPSRARLTIPAHLAPALPPAFEHTLRGAQVAVPSVAPHHPSRN